MNEIETKILEVDSEKVKVRMSELGARQVLETVLTVDWYGPADIYNKAPFEEGKDPWFLRIRKSSDGKSEVTWKGKSEILGVSRSHKEINFTVSDYEKSGLFLEAVGLVHYAHQEKKRVSWVLGETRFDLDEYPHMPPYLEIEGPSEESIQESIKLCGLENYPTSSEGERVLIQKRYHLDWYNMKF